MPQMAPLNWLSLMLFFLMILTTFIILNYYIYQYKSITSTMTSYPTRNTWKW
uniref:ATP synthase complex subunit 8 n=1 Tax=Tenebrionoidea sp. 18 KM-2017 TaxID=2219473 RepID=A0A346RHJ6_9CUCU|nr:ATP synthase F0 subunit 8 [Tenebrionoidea sp. 18 KM-2017]